MAGSERVDTPHDSPGRTMTPATAEKRADLLLFIEQEVQKEHSVQGVVAVGSVGSGCARPDSDIDAVVFLDPFDLYAVPAEFFWCPSDGSFHRSFSQDAPRDECIAFDFFRFAFNQWADPGYVWPEARCAELQEGWIAFDRCGTVGALLEERTRFSEELRTARLDGAILRLDHDLSGDKAERNWKTFGPEIAHDKLNAAYGLLVQALFAYSRRWRSWRDREMEFLLKLPWLPSGFSENVLHLTNAPALDYAGYVRRVSVMREAFGQILARVVADGDYGPDPVNEMFMRNHDEPGRDWNMSQWVAEHRKRASGKPDGC